MSKASDLESLSVKACKAEQKWQITIVHMFYYMGEMGGKFWKKKGG
jgi:hypothetical protein